MSKPPRRLKTSRKNTGIPSKPSYPSRKSSVERNSIKKTEIKIYELIDIGNEALQKGDKDNVLKNYNQALKLAQQINIEFLIAYCVTVIGRAHRLWGNYKEAIDYNSQSVELCKKVHDKYGEVTNLNNLGEIFRLIGEGDEALRYFTQALELINEVIEEDGENTPNKKMKGTILNNLGLVYQDREELEEALDYFFQDLQILKDLNDPLRVSSTLNNIGLIHQARGKHNEARDFFKKSLEIRDKIGKKGDEAKGVILSNLATEERILRNYNRAITYHLEALKIAERFNAIYNLAVISRGLAKDYKAISQYQKSLNYLQKSLSYYRTVLANIPIGHQEVFESKFNELYNVIPEIKNLIDNPEISDTPDFSTLMNELKGIKELIQEKNLVDKSSSEQITEIIQRMEKKVNKIHDFQIAEYSIPLILDPTNFKIIKSKTKKKLYVKVHCICCGKTDDILIEKRDRTWFKVGKTICYGILCGASIISIIGNFPKMVGFNKNFAKSVKNLDFEQMLIDLKNIGEGIGDINDEILELKDQINRIKNLKADGIFISSELAKTYNKAQIQALQDLFLKENQDVASRYRESKYGLYIHKDCDCDE